MHGRKKVFQAGLLFAAIGAVVALSAQSVQVLWVGQALAGPGAAALLPTTLALISHAVPAPHQRAKFVGLWAAALMTALATGPLMAGVILEHAARRWIYLPAIPVAVLSTVVAVPLVADSRAPGSRRPDWPGQITAVLAITSLVYGVIEGGADSFSEPKAIVALTLAAVSAQRLRAGRTAHSSRNHRAGGAAAVGCAAEGRRASASRPPSPWPHRGRPGAG